jgi:hypothetical protein
VSIREGSLNFFEYVVIVGVYLLSPPQQTDYLNPWAVRLLSWVTGRRKKLLLPVISIMEEILLGLWEDGTVTGEADFSVFLLPNWVLIVQMEYDILYFKRISVLIQGTNYLGIWVTGPL